MAQQLKLFAEPSTTVQLDDARREPLLWVSRLVILEDPETIIRDIPLRRGLNIIWSPDPGADAASLGEDAGSGHGAGKTLFCRLLRYCLGEPTFANIDLRRSIAKALPTGLVGAEVMVNGNLWSVIRPIGSTRKHWAVQGQGLEEVLETDGLSTGIDPLISVISEQALTSNLIDSLPGQSSNRDWLFGLGWMSRDQECRYDHILDWRHADADTGSPLRDLSKEETLLVVRLFLRLISTDEMDIRRQRAGLRNERELESEISFSHRQLLQTGEELKQALDIALTVPLDDPLGVGTLSNAAKENLANIQNESVPEASVEQLTPLRERRDNFTGEIAVLEEQIKRTDAMIELQKAQEAKLKGEKSNLDGDSIRAHLGDYCPVCNVSIDRALAEGCGLSHMLQDVEKIDNERTRKEVVLKNCADLMKDYENQKSEKEKLIENRRGERAGILEQIQRIEEADRANHDSFSRKLYTAENMVRRCERLNRYFDTKNQAQKDLEDRNKQDQVYLEQLEKLREQHRDALVRLNQLFDYVAKGVLGVNTKGSLSLSGQRLQANVQIGGLAMVSLKAVVFDLAALLMSLEGRSELPTFLIHDSPREADLGLSVYHRLFRLLAELEKIGDEAPFQYIVSTTTDPPKELRDEHLVLTLDGANSEQKLLRRDFLGGLDAS